MNTDSFVLTKTTRIAKVYIDEYGFCRVALDTSRHNHMGAEEAHELCDAIHEVCQGKPHKILTDGSKVIGSVAPESRKIIRNHPGMLKVRKAEAFVSRTLATKMIFNFYIRFDRPPNPTKVFTEVDGAIEWLKSIEID